MESLSLHYEKPIDLKLRDFGVEFSIKKSNTIDSIVVIDQQSVCSLHRLLTSQGIKFEQQLVKEDIFCA